MGWRDAERVPSPLTCHAGAVGIRLRRCRGAQLLGCEGSSAGGDRVLQGKIISLLIKHRSRVLAAQPAEGQVVRPPVRLYSDQGWAREGNYQLAQEIDTPGHLLSLPKLAGAASLSYF